MDVILKEEKANQSDHLCKEESPCYHHITSPISLVQQRMTFAANVRKQQGY